VVIGQIVGADPCFSSVISEPELFPRFKKESGRERYGTMNFLSCQEEKA